MIYIISTLILFLCLLFYFRVAKRFNIIDRPNERSSHTEYTIRGGGIVFLLAVLFAGIRQPEYLLPVFGAGFIGTVSFLDDRISLSNKLRFVSHFLSVSLLFYYLEIFQLFPWYVVIFLYILVIGIINAYNFMDGINGITGLYSLVVLGGLQYVNFYVIEFVPHVMIWLPMVACLVFLFFNFRAKAICFAGDVGSITIAYWIIFLLLKLILLTGDFSYMLFLSLYGVDSVFTIIHRLYLRQNIFQAHRLHFYQVLANELKLPHVLVSTTYALVQGLIIAIVLISDFSFWHIAPLVISPLLLIYLLKFRWVKASV